MNQFSITLLSLILTLSAYGQHEDHQTMPTMKSPSMKSKMPRGAKDCSENEVWDYSTASCRSLAMAGMPMTMWMLHGNAFFVQTTQEGPRGNNRFAVPNMIMSEAGRSVGDNHYVDVNLMMTFEKWTFPKEGYPELFQIGEKNEDDKPYIDGQHPHSSPVMGITLSDTIRLGDGKDYLRLFFAPRGQATDGPIAFMHRPSGMMNPDAPLGHHIGQDVSHITSTVLGTSLGIGKIRIEASVFHGEEPKPSKVDLPMGELNSYAGRLIYEISDDFSIMASAGMVKDPEPDDPTLEKVSRYSISSYIQHHLDNGWLLHDTLIFGLMNNYDHVSALRSILYEFWLHSDQPSNYWGRVEFVERTGAELNITNISKPQEPGYVTAITAGYTYDVMKLSDGKLGLGISATKNFSPAEFKDTYGGDPWSGKVFVQLSGMKMVDFGSMK
ncbi:MAG: hypothetical protein B7Y39_08570 [Bdellovibrio sp. 28-41-41]|nr:MAG: hypothetical protein B7Y39_08570 [Bdellovibrio sp. 28-41-41]